MADLGINNRAVQTVSGPMDSLGSLIWPMGSCAAQCCSCPHHHFQKSAISKLKSPGSALFDPCDGAGTLVHQLWRRPLGKLAPDARARQADDPDTLPLIVFLLFCATRSSRPHVLCAHSTSLIHRQVDDGGEAVVPGHEVHPRHNAPPLAPRAGATRSRRLFRSVHRGDT